MTLIEPRSTHSASPLDSTATGRHRPLVFCTHGSAVPPRETRVPSGASDGRPRALALLGAVPVGERPLPRAPALLEARLLRRESPPRRQRRHADTVSDGIARLWMTVSPGAGTARPAGRRRTTSSTGARGRSRERRAETPDYWKCRTCWFARSGRRLPSSASRRPSVERNSSAGTRTRSSAPPGGTARKASCSSLR